MDKANLAELDLDMDGVISRDELMIAMKVRPLPLGACAGCGSPGVGVKRVRKLPRLMLTLWVQQMKAQPDEAKMAAIADCLDADHDGKLRLDVLQQVMAIISTDQALRKAHHRCCARS